MAPRAGALQTGYDPSMPLAAIIGHAPIVALLRQAVGCLPARDRVALGQGEEVPVRFYFYSSTYFVESSVVIPANAVAAIGNGSNKAGAQKLQRMIDRVGKPKRVTLPA